MASDDDDDEDDDAGVLDSSFVDSEIGGVATCCSSSLELCRDVVVGGDRLLKDEIEGAWNAELDGTQ